MLDFYLIADSASRPKPDQLDKLDYLGELESAVYSRLIKKGIIDSRFDYYSDFRWTNSIIQQIRSRIKNFSADADVLQVLKIIDQVSNLEFGLIAFGD